MSRWMSIMTMPAATSNERLRLPTMGNHGNCHLLLHLNLVHVVWTAVSGNLRDLVLWIGWYIDFGFGLLNQIARETLD